MSEKILGVAIYQQGEVHRLPSPATHRDVVEYMELEGIENVYGEKGFYTDNKEFVTREDALQIAVEAGQVDSREAKFRSKLYSGDLV